MKTIRASTVFPISGPPIQNGEVLLSDDDTVVAIREADLCDNQTPYYEGILLPGFVNAHTHIELSHLANKTQKNQGLVKFLGQVGELKDQFHSTFDEIKNANKVMYSEGINCVGDVCNGNTSNQVKTDGLMQYYSFFELYGKRNHELNNKIHNISTAFTSLESPSKAIVPHAIYDVHPMLFDYINKQASINPNYIFSIHNQESPEEERIFNNHSGEFIKMYTDKKIDYSFFDLKFSSSLDYLLSLLDSSILQRNNCLLVHNTFTSEADLEKIEKNIKNCFWVMCPLSNWFIEKKLPDLNMFWNKGVKVAIGTDSLASNDRLSILEELKMINKYFPLIPLQDLFKWATVNGAMALGFDAEYGTITPGKKCGLILIENVSVSNNDIQNAKVKRII